MVSTGPDMSQSDLSQTPTQNICSCVSPSETVLIAYITHPCCVGSACGAGSSLTFSHTVHTPSFILKISFPSNDKRCFIHCNR